MEPRGYEPQLPLLGEAEVIIPSGRRGDAPLTSRVARAAAWSYGLALLKAALAFILSVVLARQLGPRPFGLVAIALLVVTPGTLLVEAGAGAALIQREELTEVLIARAFTWQIGTGTILGLLTAALAGPVASLFHTPQAAAVVRAIAPIFVLQSVSLVSIALLRRRLSHRTVLLVQTGSYAFAYGVVAVPLALFGAGVWALVAAQLLQATVSSALLVRIAPHRWQLRKPWKDKELSRFSSEVLRVNALNWAIENGDNLLIGGLFGSLALGIYGRAYATLRAPTDAVSTSLSAVAFAGHSRAMSTEASRRGYVASFNAISLVLFPLLAVTATLGGALVQALYGFAWRAAAPLVAPLSVAMGCHCMVAVSGPVLWARDRVRWELWAQLFTILAFGGSALVLHRSVYEVAWLVAGIYALRGTLLLSLAKRSIDLRARALLRAGISGLRPAVVAVGASRVVSHYISSAVGVILIGLAAAGISVLAAVMFMRSMEFSDELLDAVSTLSLPLFSRRAERVRIANGLRNVETTGSKQPGFP